MDGGAGMVEINENVEIDLADSERKPVTVNCAGGSHVTVNVSVRNFSYPEWLDKMVHDHIKLEDG
jgi:hypothetical protein